VKIPSKYIENAVDQLSSLPGIGKRTALRLVLQLLNRTEGEIEQFAHVFTDMKQNVKKCSSCGNVSDTEICSICLDLKRDHSIICVVEDIRDVLAIETTESYKGIYHVLGGIISPMDGVGPSDLNINSLIEKASSGEIFEVIFALSPTMEGDTTNFYLFKKLEAKPIIITSLSRGVSVGTELQYADELTLSRSLQQRQPFKI
jgi:recombination protein RecR